MGGPNMGKGCIILGKNPKMLKTEYLPHDVCYLSQFWGWCDILVAHNMQKDEKMYKITQNSYF